jgi:phosphoribosylaminoimidazole-succinocarboxamide synthase
MVNGFHGKAGETVPEMTNIVVQQISDRYIELYEHLIGEIFIKKDSSVVLHRIEENINQFLASQLV